MQGGQVWCQSFLTLGVFLCSEIMALVQTSWGLVELGIICQCFRDVIPHQAPMLGIGLFFKAIWPAGPQARSPWRLFYYQIDFYGPDARNGIIFVFTSSNGQILHQTWKVSQRNYSHTYFKYFPVSSHQRFPFIIQGLLK